MKVNGFTLLELLVASALSIVLMGGLITIYLSIKTNNNLQQALTNLQESGRFALYILNQRIRVAGLVNCKNKSDPVDQDQAIIGYDSSNLPYELQDQVESGTDAVVINSCSDNSSISLNTQLTQMAYFIGDTYRKNSQGQRILALFQKPLNGDRIELVQGVEQMQNLYGVVVSGVTGLAYYPAKLIDDWKKVRIVQINLLMNSVEPILTKPQSYNFNMQEIRPSDLLIHQPWSTDINLRERFNEF